MPIIDTSVVLTVLLREPLAELAAAALSKISDRHAPDILHLEIANAAIGAVRSKRLSNAEATRLLEEALVFPIVLHATTQLVPRAFEISLTYQRRPYDGAYLALAESRQDVLLTTDLKLANGMKGTPLQNLVKVIGKDS